MKRLPVVFALLVMCITCHAQITVGLVSHWTLDGPDATGLWPDSFGTNNLTSINGVSTAPGWRNLAADFYINQSQSLTCPSTPDFQVGDSDFTISARVNLRTKNPLAVQEVGIFHKTDGYSQDEWNLYYDPVHDAFVFYVMHPGMITTAVFAPAANCPVGTWHLLTGWMDHVSKKMYLHLQVDNLPPLSTRILKNASVQITNSPVSIGAFDATSGFFDGQIDEVFFWRRALTDSDRNTIWTGAY